MSELFAINETYLTQGLNLSNPCLFGGGSFSPPFPPGRTKGGCVCWTAPPYILYYKVLLYNTILDLILKSIFLFMFSIIFMSMFKFVVDDQTTINSSFLIRLAKFLVYLVILLRMDFLRT